MKILFLDLASNSTQPSEGSCIACVSEQKTEAIRFIDHRAGDHELVPILDQVLQEAGWTDHGLTHIACVTGPGGFTSLRVAVTLANTYGDQLNIPAAPIHLSDLYIHRVEPPCHGGSTTSPHIWLHSTKKTQLFIRSFGSSQWPEPTLITLDDLVAQLPANASIIGEILPEHREAIAGKNPIYPVIAPIAEILPEYLSSLTYDQKQIVPWYGRGW